MLGAIIGDIVGSVYEFNNTKKTDFPFFSERSTYTDDSIMTVAVAAWLISDKTHSHFVLENKMVSYAEEYPHPMGGYGGGFAQWLFRPERLVDYKTGETAGRRVPYNSWGNGSAMRVSAVGWMFDTLEETERVAKISAEITHDHPEGIKGAQATAAAIFLARTGSSKTEIRDYIAERFNYSLYKSSDEIRREYGWEDSCQGTVPPAIRAFLDSEDFESAIRIAVSLGGDSDTLACITGGIAEAFYGYIPSQIVDEARKRIPVNFRCILESFAEVSFYGDIKPRTGLVLPFERKYSPERIDSLAPRQIFVFGSNEYGHHHGGAARAAYEKFGAVWGKGVGLSGRTYAIPTMQGGVETIRPYVDEFIDYARNRPELTYLVTRIGCGIAGFKDEEIAPLFIGALDLPNVHLPKSFCEIILSRYNMFEEDAPIWNVKWYPELTPDIPLDDSQYESFCRGYYPTWDCRYAPIKIGDWHYFVRSGCWLKKYRYEKKDDGMYHLVESYTSSKEMGRNLLMECFEDGFYKPRVLSDCFAREYFDMYGDYLTGARLTIGCEEKPDKCLYCGKTSLKDVIYGEPSGRLDEEHYVLGGCCINEYSHDWECPECHSRFKQI
ncbi:MAG: ADP-ribosylglycohydrolase family protein [Bacteroidales bacterium]|nr:ADP-ribosylglycohydrolase family protein [Bacteroidales bacterium]